MSVRFAPSPTGNLHLGNFRTAWISWAWAQALKMPWHIRFEDIDLPRIVPGCQQRQLNDLKALGLEPENITTQTAHRQRHWELLLHGRSKGDIYACICSRKDILNSLASAPHSEQALYSGRCRAGVDTSQAKQIAWRFKSKDPSGKNDFIVARSNPLMTEDTFVPAYHWACAIDDWDEGHSLLVRAVDLASAASIQREIQNWLRAENDLRSIPAIFHTALVVQDSGARLEKRTAGVTLTELMAAGYTSQRLHRIFRNTISLDPSEFSNGRVWSEPAETLSISSLLDLQ